MSLTSPDQFEDDPDIADYLIQLRETLVECYMTIVHGVTQQQTKANLVPFAQNILGFLQQLTTPQLNPTKE